MQRTYTRGQDPEAHLEQRRNERTDAAWAELQNTLGEVELSAMNEMQIFGPNHAKALDELRIAQLALAQAWARGEGEDESDVTLKDSEERLPSNADVLGSDADPKKSAGSHKGASGRVRSGSVRSAASGKSQLEDETETDILLARKRREANDRHFKKVNAGVLDVVAKLEEVAKAMKEVEIESREIWGEGESLESGSTNE